jgi:hypothetical protein
MARVAVTPDGTEYRFPDQATDTQIHDAVPNAVLRVASGGGSPDPFGAVKSSIKRALVGSQAESIGPTPPWWLQKLRSANEALPGIASMIGGGAGAAGAVGAAPETGGASLLGITPAMAAGTAAGAGMGVLGRNAIRPWLGYHTPDRGALRNVAETGRDIGGAVAGNEAALLSGGILGRMAQAGGGAAMRSALSSPQTAGLTREAQQTLSRQSGLPVEPQVASLSNQAIRGRMAPGVRSPKILIDQLASSRGRLVAKADAAGHTTTIDPLLAEVDKLRGELALRTDSKGSLPALDKMKEELRSQWMNLGRTGGFEGFKDIIPSMVQKLKDKWQDEALPVFNQLRASMLPKSTTPPPEADALLRARFAQSAASGAQKWLEELPAVGGKIKMTNSRIARLLPLDKAIDNATLRHLGAPPRVLSGLVGGTVGLLSGHGYPGAVAGVAAGSVAAEAARNPTLTGRLGLTLTESPLGTGVAQRALKYGPRGVPALLEWLSNPAGYNPDSTQVGGR